MWLLQPRQYKHRHLWIRLSIISCVLHGLLLCLLFVGYSGSLVNYHMRIGTSVHRGSSSLVFVPLAKSIKRPHSSGAFGGGVNSSMAKSKPATKTAGRASLQKLQKTPAKKPKKQAALVQKKETVTKQAISPKQELKKTEEQKKPFEKKSKPLEQKSVAKKGADKKLDESVKSIQPVEKVQATPAIEPVKVQENETVVMTYQDVVPIHERALAQGIDISSSDVSLSADVTYIGQAERDALYMQELIKHEVEHNWRPPLGLSKELECDIQLCVDWQGKPVEMKIIRPSGVLAYDASARAALRVMAFPVAMRGKQFCMNFKQ